MREAERYQTLFGRYDRKRMRRFLDYVRDRPEHFRLFRQLATEYRAAGNRRCGAAMIGNVMRWHLNLRHADEAYKVNNNHIPLLARLLIYKDASFEGFFELRN